jgi:uncharacterized membrane-anchored protein YhcB (DUF1043 family)
LSPEFWIGLVVATGVAFFIGRWSASKRADALKTRLDSLQAELNTTREQAEADLALAREKAAAVEEGVTNHFEQSATLFGKLAQDYRAFFEHFSTSAQQLGVSEGVARKLLAQLDEPLISESPEAEATLEIEAAAEEEATPEGPAPTQDAEPPILDPISAKVAELELGDNKTESPDASRQAG